ncbi:MAG TPA: hypothetical protein VFZ34_28010 [Blastocatellia bacterium]|nr:hypothetical protein [Blastocatellia bacterium]
MPRLDDKLAELKTLLQSGDDFSVISSCFFDLSEMPAFMDIGKVNRNKELKEKIEIIIEHAAQQVLPGELILHGLMLIELPKRNFVHGPIGINNYMCNIFYFTDIKSGMLTITSLRPGALTHFVRLTELPVTDPRVMVVNPARQTNQ